MSDALKPCPFCGGKIVSIGGLAACSKRKCTLYATKTRLRELAGIPQSEGKITLSEIRNAIELSIIRVGDVVEVPMRNALIDLDLASMAVHNLIYGRKI